MRNYLITSLAAAGLLLVAGTANASLPVGAKAPAFVTQGAKGGKELTFDLKKALKSGPVVLYFYPKAFTGGCTLEAHAFADATGDFAKYGASVVGMSADDLPTLKRFSTEACRDKFTVAIADKATIKGYDVALAKGNMTDRTSYVIAQNGKITFVHSELDYRDHVKLTLEAVKALSTRKH
jgi:peroxiredoxin